MNQKLAALILIFVLTIPAAAPVAAAPAAVPCAAGGSYNPACDVNQDGSVNILDVQLTAGHWNQTGTFTSDNNHNHLGQTWTGSANPLILQGSFGSPSWAPLSLSNSSGAGVRVNALGGSGVWVESAILNGVLVDSAGGDGVFICHTGTASSCSPSVTNNGVEIGNAQGDGLRVGSAGRSGLYVGLAGIDGVHVDSASYNGVYVSSAGTTGFYADTEQPSGQWGLFTPDAIYGSNVLLQSLSLVAQVTGPDELTPGDIVAVAGVADPVPGSTVHTPLVRLAGGTFANLVGVVESRLALTEKPNHALPTEAEARTEARASELRSVDGPAQAGDYVAITVLGAAQVKVDGATPIEAGKRLTVADNGRARPLGTIKVQLAGGEGTADMVESAPIVGVAIEPAKDGMVWVLVNPQ